MDPQRLLQELSSICSTPSSNEKSKQSKSINKEQMWKILIEIASVSTKQLGMYYPLVIAYADRFPAFRMSNPKFVSAHVSKFADKRLSESERIKLSVPLLLLLPFLSKENVIAFITESVAFAQDLLSSKGCIPLEFLDTFDEAMCEDLTKDSLFAIFDVIKSSLSTENAAGALLVFAPLSHNILSCAEDSLELIIEKTIEFLGKEKTHQMSACFMLEYFSIYFEDNPYASPPSEQLFDLILPLLMGSDEFVRKRAFKAFQALIQAGVFLSSSVVIQFIGKFAEFSSSDSLLVFFFKLLNTFINPEEEESEEEDGSAPDSTIIQPILDFSTETLKNSKNPLIKGFCLDVLSSLAGRDQMYIEDCYQKALTEAEEIIDNGHFHAFPWVSSFLVALSKCFLEDTKKTISPKLPILMSAVQNPQTGTLKERLNLAIDISVMVDEGLNDSIIDPLVEFGISQLQSTELKIVLSTCALFVGLKDKLNDLQSNQIYSLVSEKVLKTLVSEELNVLLQTLRKLMKKSTIKQERVDSILNSIMKGELAILAGEKPHTIQPPELFVFRFLETCIRKYPSKCKEVCNELIDWIGTSQFAFIPAILEPLSVGVETGAVDEKQASTLVQILKNFLGKLDSTDIEELNSTNYLLMKIWEVHPASLEPIDPIFDHLHSIVESISGGEEEESMEASYQIIPSIAHLTFTIYSTSDTVEVRDDYLVSLFDAIPDLMQIEDSNEILECLVQMLENPDRFKCILVQVLDLFVNLLMNRKSDLEKCEVQPDTIKSMKEVLKNVLKNNSDIKKEIVAQFQGSRAKLNRFNLLIR